MSADAGWTPGRLVIVTPYYDGVGGVAVAVRQLANEFRSLGYEVLTLARGHTTGVVPDEIDSAVFRVRLRVPTDTIRSWVAFLLMAPITLLRLRSFLAAQRAQVVLVQYANPGHFYFGILRRFAPWRLFVTFQGDDAHNIGSCRRAYKSLYRVLLQSADGITGVSQSLLRKVRTAVPSASRHAAVIPNGAPRVAARSESAAVPRDYALTVGLLQHRKGIDILIRALGVLKRRGIRQRVLIVGMGQEREALGRLAEREDVTAEAVFAGEKSHADVLSLMQGGSFFVLASRAEGLPLVIVEAMMCGLPAVATNIDGIPEIVTHEENGLLVEAEQVEQLADAMQRIGRDQQLRERLGAAARRTAEGFEWRRIAERYLSHFGEAGVQPLPTGLASSQAPTTSR